jgi:hypothetical protein
MSDGLLGVLTVGNLKTMLAFLSLGLECDSEGTAGAIT